MSSSQKIDLQRDFAAGVYISEAPSSPKIFWDGLAILKVLNLVRYRV